VPEFELVLVFRLGRRFGFRFGFGFEQELVFDLLTLILFGVIVGDVLLLSMADEILLDRKWLLAKE